MAWIVFAVVIGIAIVSAISQKMKNTEDRRPAPKARRAKPRPVQQAGTVRTSSSGDIDRFLQEIDKLRKKATDSPVRPVANAVPTVQPTNKKAKSARAVPTSQRPEHLPTASLLQTTTMPASTLHVITRPTAAGSSTAGKATGAMDADTISALGKPGERMVHSGPATDFSRDMLALLKSPSALPMAIVLQEVLGPPRCKRRG